MSEWNVHDNAFRKAEYLGIAYGDDVSAVLSMMVSESAQTSHKRGNRRYGSFVLKVQDGKILDVFIDDISKAFCPDCFDSKVSKVWEQCEVCEGDGCDDCFSEGGRVTTIRCQACK